MLKYVQTSISTALMKQSSLNLKPLVTQQLANRISQELFQTAMLENGEKPTRELNQQLAILKGLLLRGINRGELNHIKINDGDNLDIMVSAALDLIHKEAESKDKAASMYHTISSHHKSLRASDTNNIHNNMKQIELWERSTSSTIPLAEYSQAAKAMGQRAWVKDGMLWCQYQINHFYYDKGWIFKKLSRSNKKRWGVERSPLTSSITQLLLLRNESRLSRQNPLVPPVLKLLDVGSCYNPFSKMNNCVSHERVTQNGSTLISYPAFDVTAIDLCPHPDCNVLKCDFLSCSIIEGSNEDPIVGIGLFTESPPIKTDESPSSPSSTTTSPSTTAPSTSSTASQILCVEYLKAESFDVVVMSLVLSYIPDPFMRASMILRAYDCLIKPSFKETNKAGLLILFERGSIAHPQGEDRILPEWVSYIESVGFLLVKYEFINNKGIGHAFAFQTIPREKPIEVSPLRIKQDNSR